jgi:hypothetical protein
MTDLPVSRTTGPFGGDRGILLAVALNRLLGGMIVVLVEARMEAPDARAHRFYWSDPGGNCYDVAGLSTMSESFEFWRDGDNKGEGDRVVFWAFEQQVAQLSYRGRSVPVMSYTEDDIREAERFARGRFPHLFAESGAGMFARIIGGSHKPFRHGKHQGSHPAVVNKVYHEALERFPEAADVIAALPSGRPSDLCRTSS